MEENIEGSSCNSNANKLCYILTGSSNAQIASRPLGISPN